MTAIIFRCDASYFIGSGHVMRCLTLARVLQSLGATCLFCCVEGTESVTGDLVHADFKIIRPDELWDQKTDMVIVDHYGLDVDFETKVRAVARHVVAIDDLCNRSHNCDILLSQNLIHTEKDYEALIPSGCRIFSGSEYLLLRPEFQSYANKKIRRHKPPRSLLLFFGATNPVGLTVKILTLLEKIDLKGTRIDVVIGVKHSWKDEVQNLCKIRGANLHVQTQEMAKLMAAADMAVGCGGTAIWERLALGVPTLEIAHADWQIPTLKVLDRQGYLVYIGKHDQLSDSDIADRLVAALRDGLKIRHCSCGTRIDHLARCILEAGRT